MPVKKKTIKKITQPKKVQKKQGTFFATVEQDFIIISGGAFVILLLLGLLLF